MSIKNFAEGNNKRLTQCFKPSGKGKFNELSLECVCSNNICFISQPGV